MKLTKLAYSLLLGGTMLATVPAAQAALTFGQDIYICDGTSNCTDVFDQFNVNWTARSIYTDSNNSGTVNVGETVVDTTVAPNYGGMGLLKDGSNVPLGFNTAGYGSTWEFFFTYNLNGTVVAVTSPDDILANYTGDIDVYYNTNATRDPGSDLLVLTIGITNNNLDLANFILDGTVTYALDGYFFFADGNQDFGSASGTPITIQARVDTNLDTDQVPTAGACPAGTPAGSLCRESTLNGSVGFVTVPEPGSLALLGIGLAGLGLGRRQRKSN